MEGTIKNRVTGEKRRVTAESGSVWPLATDEEFYPDAAGQPIETGAAKPPTAEIHLREALAMLRAQRRDPDSEDERRRISLSITSLEQAILWLTAGETLS